MGNFKLILNLIKKKGIYLICLIFFISFLELISVGIIGTFFETVTSINSESSIISIQGYKIKFNIFCLIFGFILITITFLSSFSTYLINKYGIKIGFEIAVKIFDNYLQDMSKIKNSRPNDFISKIYNETNRFATNIVVQSFHLANKVLISILIVAALIYTDYMIALFTGTIILFTGVLYVKLTKSTLSENSTQITFLNNERLKILNETVGGIDYLKTYNKINSQVNAFEKASFDFAERHSINQTIGTLPKYLLETVFMISLILYSVFLNANGKIDQLTSVLFLFGAAGLKLLPSINIIINSISKIRANLDSFYILRDDMEAIIQNSEQLNTKIKINSVDNIFIKIKNFSFNDNTLIRDKVFNFKKNNWYHIKGESGSGKSTLVRLLLKIYNLENGKIEINNININKIDLENYYLRIGYVSQKIYLFDGSIDYNISLEKKPNIQKLEQLKKSCNINFNNQDLYNLSGGQIQRIGIARALYKDNDVLIIDEAFTGLDKNNHNKIMDYIMSISKNKIII